MRSRLSGKVLAGLLLAGAVLYGLPADAQLPGFPAAKSASASAGDVPALRSSEEIARELAAAKAALAAYESAGESPADAPAGTSPLEIGLRLSLARQLASILQQQLDALAHTEEARKRLAEAERQREEWRGFATPPPHSVLLVDAVRDEFEYSQGRVAQAQARRAFIARVEAQISDRIRESQAAARLAAEAADRHGLVLGNPKPQVYLEEFTDNAVSFALTYWVDLAPDADPRRVKSDLLHMIDRAFAEAGIAIPFPQRDVRLAVERPVPVSVVAPGPQGPAA